MPNYRTMSEGDLIDAKKVFVTVMADPTVSSDTAMEAWHSMGEVIEEQERRSKS